MSKVIQRSNLQIWIDVIFAIFLREIKSKFNDKLGIAWSVISPLAFIFMLAFIRGLMDGGETHGIPTFFFMVYGLLYVQLFIGVVGAVSNSIKKNKPLYAFRQVQPISSVIAISSFEILSKTFVMLIIGVISYYLKYDFIVHDPIGLIFNFIQVGFLGISVGLIFALTSSFIPEIDKLRTLVMRPVFFISGIFFSLQDIPKDLWPYLTWNPLLHAVELTRFAAYPHYGNIGVSSFYLGLCTLLALFFSLACYHISWKQAISR